MATYSAISVADYIINKASESNNTLTPMQVIKLVYLCHGWMLGLYGRPLISEPIEAWRYGPVIDDLYQAVKKFRSNPVTGSLARRPVLFTDDEKNIMDQVVRKYERYSGPALSRLTHAKGTPWSQTIQSFDNYISNDLIEDHFKKLASVT